MLCTELVVPPTIKNAWAAPNASAASSSASRMTGYRVAEIIQRLHAVDIHPNALLAQKGGQFRVAAAALVTGHIKGNHAHLAEIFQRFVDGGAALVQPERVCFSPFIFTSVRGSLGSAVWQNKKRKPCTGVQTCV